MDVKLKHKRVPITVLDGPYLQKNVPTPLAIEHYSEIISSLDEIRRFAAKQLLKKYNDNWRDEGAGRLNQKDFIARLVKPTVQLYDEIGVAIVYFGDSGLFGGHHVQVSIDNGAPTHARIA